MFHKTCTTEGEYMYIISYTCTTSVSVVVFRHRVGLNLRDSPPPTLSLRWSSIYVNNYSHLCTLQWPGGKAFLFCMKLNVVVVVMVIVVVCLCLIL